MLSWKLAVFYPQFCTIGRLHWPRKLVCQVKCWMDIPPLKKRGEICRLFSQLLRSTILKMVFRSFRVPCKWMCTLGSYSDLHGGAFILSRRFWKRPVLPTVTRPSLESWVFSCWRWMHYHRCPTIHPGIWRFKGNKLHNSPKNLPRNWQETRNESGLQCTFSSIFHAHIFYLGSRGKPFTHPNELSSNSLTHIQEGSSIHRNPYSGL